MPNLNSIFILEITWLIWNKNSYSRDSTSGWSPVSWLRKFSHSGKKEDREVGETNLEPNPQNKAWEKPEFLALFPHFPHYLALAFFLSPKTAISPLHSTKVDNTATNHHEKCQGCQKQKIKNRKCFHDLETVTPPDNHTNWPSETNQ